MKDNHYTNSRRSTPWDDIRDLSSLESFIRDTYHKRYDRKHLKLSHTNEAMIINSYAPKICPHCKAVDIVKFGLTKNGIQRYKCLECNKTFTPVTGTLFEDHKISIEEWIDFLYELLSYESFSNISRNNKNSLNTTIYWLNKLFLVLEHYSNGIVLEGNVYIDETFYTLRSEDIKVKDDGKKPRGLSLNKMCIAIGYDGIHTYARYEGQGKTSKRKTRLAFKDHIKIGSHLIHDKEKSHSVLIDDLHLTSEAYDSKVIKELSDDKNPLEPINRKCYYLKRFLNSHQGFNRDDIDDLINLFLFIDNPPHDKLEKIKDLLDGIFNTQVRLKYRDEY